MTDIEVKFLLAGPLTCNYGTDTCEWTMPFAGGITVARMMQEMYQHAFTNHGECPEEIPCCKRFGCGHPPIPWAEVKPYPIDFAYPPGIKDRDTYDQQTYLEGDAETSAAAARRMDVRKALRLCGGCGEPLGDGLAHGPGVCV